MNNEMQEMLKGMNELVPSRSRARNPNFGKKLVC